MIGLADVLSVYRATGRHRRASRDEILTWRDAWLRRLIAHAYDRVPYYRALFDRHGVEPRAIRTAADLARIPVSAKRDLRAAPPGDLVARPLDPARLLVHMTSGSSGEPLTIRRTWAEERIGSAFRLRALHDFGARPWHKRVAIVSLRPRDPLDWSGPQRIVRALGLYRKAMLDCRVPVPELVRDLQALRPDVISTSPGIAAIIGRTLPNGGPNGRWPRLVVTGGEVLTPPLRRQIGESFGATVMEVYATYEFGIIAWQCPRVGTLHVADDGVIFEVLKDGRPAEPGEAGEVVVTRLHAFAMPFIRYRLGDLVTQGEPSCPCGAPFSTILTIQGRMVDYFVLPGGRLFHPYQVLTGILGHAARWLGQYQLTQERTDRVVIRVLPLTAPTAAEVSSLEQVARAALGPGVEFQVLLVEDMPLEVNGKFRVSRSFVASDYDDIDWERRRADDLAAARSKRADIS